MGRNVLLGFAGPGNVTKNTVKDLLRDHLNLGPEGKNGLPDYPEGVDEIRVLFPADDDWITPTVKLLWEWTDDYGEFPYEAFYSEETRKNAAILDNTKQAVEVRNVAHSLIERMVEGKKDGDKVTLIVAWGDKGDDNTEMLIELAQAKEIPVKDLTAGLDDLNFDDQEEPEPEPEPRRRRTAKDRSLDTEQPVEEEKPRARRGKPRNTAETSPEPAEATQEESVEAEVSKARHVAQTAAETAMLPEGADTVLRALIQARNLVRGLDVAHAAMTLNADRVPCELFKLLGEAIEKYQADNEAAGTGADPLADKPKRSAGRPRKDGSPAEPRSPRARGVMEYYDEDAGEWVKKGRGRPPKDAKTRMVDPKTGDVLDES